MKMLGLSAQRLPSALLERLSLLPSLLVFF
jgi:hypothetical protein